MSILTERISGKIDYGTDVDRVGFRKNFSTCDPTQLLQQLIEKAVEYETPLFLRFIDFDKAFDSIDTSYTWGASAEIQIDNIYTEVLKNIYSEVFELEK